MCSTSDVMAVQESKLVQAAEVTAQVGPRYCETLHNGVAQDLYLEEMQRQAWRTMGLSLHTAMRHVLAICCRIGTSVWR
jgi:hypothetical protein